VISFKCSEPSVWSEHLEHSECAKVTKCFNHANDTFFFAGAKYFNMYPGVMGFDVTNGTNKEKRPMARGTVKNSDNRNVPIFNALLPSISSWVFRWIFHDAIPKLFSKESLSNLRLILVDEDHHCNSQIDSARKLGILPNVQYQLCKWHKVRFISNEYSE
jgi:MULE transposase domain